MPLPAQNFSLATAAGDSSYAPGSVLAEDFIKYCAKYALELCAEDLEFFETSDFGEKGLRDRLKNVVESPFKVSSLLGLYCFVS